MFGLKYRLSPSLLHTDSLSCEGDRSLDAAVVNLALSLEKTPHNKTVRNLYTLLSTLLGYRCESCVYFAVYSAGLSV